MSVIELKDVKKNYILGDGSLYPALKGIDLIIEQKEFLTIMGPSGSGKSTMLHILGCLDKPSSGTYILNGKNVANKKDDELSQIRNENIGFVFQSFNLLPKLTVLENVMMPFLYSEVPKKERKKIAIEALENVGIADKAKSKPNQISGGQVQRVAIARSLVMNPAIILADEPTGNLDTKTGDQVMKILQDINAKGSTIIVITHERHIAKQGSRTVVLMDGLIKDKDYDFQTKYYD